MTDENIHRCIPQNGFVAVRGVKYHEPRLEGVTQTVQVQVVGGEAVVYDLAGRARCVALPRDVGATPCRPGFACGVLTAQECDFTDWQREDFDVLLRQDVEVLAASWGYCLDESMLDLAWQVVRAQRFRAPRTRLGVAVWLMKVCGVGRLYEWN